MTRLRVGFRRVWMAEMPRTVTDQHIARHEGLICRLARELALNQDMIEDLQQEGRLEVFRALAEYDSSKASEVTYLWPRVRGAMLKYLRDKAHMIRYPSCLQEQGIYPRVVLSLDGLQPDCTPADPSVDVEAAALAREALARAEAKAQVSPYQARALIDLIFRPDGALSLPPRIHRSARLARQKLRKAVVA